MCDLRAAVSRNDSLSARREEHLRQELAAAQVTFAYSFFFFSLSLVCFEIFLLLFQESCRLAEQRGQDSSVSVAMATRPLLNQLQDMRVAASDQAAAWEVCFFVCV